MSDQHLLKGLSYGFLGAGTMGQAIIRGLIDSQMIKAEQVFATVRTEGKRLRIEEEFGIQTFQSNEELVERCNVIFLGIKPQDVEEVLELLKNSIRADHTVISMAAGISLNSLQKAIRQTQRIVRIMPNTPVRFRSGVVGYCALTAEPGLEALIEAILSPLGQVVPVDEGDEFQALTVASGSGVGFVFELMIYWREWLEQYGFDQTTARQMTVQTFFGAAQLAASDEGLSLDDLQAKVVSKKGVTDAGLKSMRELEIDRALRISFEKAILRDTELGRLLS